MSKNDDTILIEIASYCDPELLNTVYSALIQADNPDRIHFAICYQSDNLEDYNELKKIKNCKVWYLKESQARGSVYARFICQHLIGNEKYIYQIDSHMRFVKHWDTKIIDQLLSLNDPKAILSVYPPYCTEDMMKLPLNDKTYDNPTDGGVMYTNGFREIDNYFLSCNTNPIKNNDPRAYKKNALIAAGNFFTFSKAHKEVLHDKEMFFYGDELPMSIRLFTHGWNVYNPGESYIYHQYERKSRKFPSITDAMLTENKRFEALLNINGTSKELGEFGLGNVRTLEEYEKFSGIIFKERKVYMNAESGEFENTQQQNRQSYLQRKQTNLYKDLTNQDDIEVIIIDFFKDYKNCIKSCLKSVKNSNNIKFLVATQDKEIASSDYCQKNNIKKIIYLKDEKYTQALAKITKYLGTGYVLLIDSSIRFSKDWDTYYLKNIKICGDNSALTSWHWLAAKDKDVDNFAPYNNIIKEFSSFNNYLPVLTYNESVDIAKKTTPYQTAFISDGSLFCKSEILKNIQIDPNLTYEEHQYIYSVRLWTYGINIYYPSISYMLRTQPENLLYTGIENLNVICALMGLNNYYGKKLEENYKYDLGTIRPLWSWYDFIGVKYDLANMQLIEEKTSKKE